MHLLLLNKKIFPLSFSKFDQIHSKKQRSNEVSVKKSWLFRGGSPYHIETGLSIWRSKQRTGFYMIETSVMKELISAH